MFIENNDIGTNKKSIEKWHRVLNHKGVKNMELALRNAGRLDPQLSKLINKVVEECSVCQKNSRSQSKPSVAIPRATDFNSIVTLDLKEMDKKYIFWIICALMIYVLLKDKKAETILNRL